MQSCDLTGRSILIVEDEPLIALDITDSLAEAGAAVTAVFTRSQALAAVRNKRFDAAILDHGLKDGDCIEICARLKAASIPFIIHSGYQGVKVPYSDVPVLTKPAPAAVLLTTLSTLLR